MFNYKKIISSVISAVMLSAAAVLPVSAEGFIKGEDEYLLGSWNFEYNSELDDKDTLYTAVTDEDSHSGSASLLMKFPKFNPDGDDLNQPDQRPQGYIAAHSRKNPYKFRAGVEYTLGFWINKKYYNTTGGAIYLRVGWVEEGKLSIAEKQPINTDGDWNQYEIKFTPSNDLTENIWILGDKLNNDTSVLIDDVYLYAAGSDENLIYDGGFEMYAVHEKYDIQTQDTFFGWNKPVWNDGTPIEESSIGYVQPTGRAARTGAKSLYIRRPSNVNDTNSSPIMLQQPLSLEPGDYTFTCYAKGDMTNNIMWSYDWDESVIKSLSAMEVRNAGDGWYKYTQAVKLTKSYSYVMLMVWRAATNGCYIDDMSLIKAGSDVDLIENGSFEDSITYEEGAPIAFTVYPAATRGVATVSWKNPYSSDITEEVLTIDGVPVDFAAELASGAVNEVVLNNLTSGQEYECALSITSGGKTVTETAVLIPNESPWINSVGDQSIIPWEFIRHDNGGNYANTVWSLDSETRYSGTASLKITGTRAANANEVYASLGQKVQLKKNTTYEFSFMIKYVGARGFQVQGIYNTNNFWSDNPQVFSGNKNWTKVIYTIDAVDGWADDDELYDRRIQFIFPNGADAVWIDDAELYELKEGTADTSVNYIKNGDFEPKAKAWEITSVTYELLLNDQVVDTIDTLESGRILPRVSIKNTAMDNFNVAAITAVYKDGVLAGFSYAEQLIPKLDSSLTPTTIGAAVDVPEMESGGEYELKVFLWNSLGTMTPLTDTYSLK